MKGGSKVLSTAIGLVVVAALGLPPALAQDPQIVPPQLPQDDGAAMGR